MLELLSDLRYRLRALFRPGLAESDLDEELRSHLDIETDRLMKEGLSPDEARRRALIAFGGVQPVKEASRDVRGLVLLEQLWRDLLHALRLMRRNPGFSLVVVLSLALGLGTTTAVFNITWNVLFAPLPVSHPEQLVVLVREGQDGRDEGFSWSEFRALSSVPGAGTFVTARGASSVSVETGEMRQYINIDFVDGGFFPLLGITPRAGRLLTPSDDEQQAPVVVLGEVFAARLFADSAAVGRIVRIRGTPFTVVGVTPRSFRGLEAGGDFSAAIPQGAVPLLARSGTGRDNRGVPYGPTDDRQGDQRAFYIVGRLAMDRAAAQAALAGTWPTCCSAGPAASGQPPAASGQLPAASDQRLVVLDIRRGFPGSKNDIRAQAQTILTLLMAGMGLVLVVVCCNIASLLLVRASARQREIAVRLSLGASRRRLVSQLMLESAPLALLGGLLALALAGWFGAGLVRSLPGDWDNIAETLRFEAGPAVLVFLGAASLLCGLAFAVYPALFATRQELGGALRVTAQSSRTRGQGTVARGAVVAQVAGTVVLVTAASLMAASLGNLFRVDGGFATDRVLLLTIESRSTSYEAGGVVPLTEAIERELRALPGVGQAAMATMLPLHGGANGFAAIGVPGFAAPNGGPPYERFIAATPGLPAAAGIRLLSGRDFGADERRAGERVAIVNQAFARRYFRGTDPVGRAFGWSAWSDTPRPIRVVGLAADVKLQDLRSAAEPLVYVPAAQAGGVWNGMGLVVRTAGEPLAAAPAVVRAIERAAPGIHVRRVRDMQTQRDWSLAVERLAARLAGFTSVMALVLSAVGLYGVVAYSTARRTAELGIRMALGARARGIVWLVLRETLAFLVLGVAIGLPLSFAANGALGSQLFGVSAHDPVLGAGSVVVLSMVALAASVVPAWRAARIDPRIALSAE